MNVPALERCVGDVGSFFDRYWGRAPLLLAPAAGGFDDLASHDDLDRMVSSLGLRASSLRMVKDGSTIPASGYTRPPSGRGTERLVDPGRVYERFSEGATIVLESLHRHWEPLTDFCRDLEISLGHRLQVNAYITPPGSQGFDVHRDSHDVFVLQVSGTKHWLVYDRDEEDVVLIDQELEPGGSLYIPKGFPHAATTTRAASAHLTVGILTHDAIAIVREVVRLAEAEPLFQERLPAETITDAASLRAVVEHQMGELRAWLDKVDVDELTQRLARRLMSTSQPIVRGQLRQLEQLEAIHDDTTLVRRRGATCVLFTGGDVLKVLLPDRELEMPLRVLPAMEEVARRDRLSARDLHPCLDADSALVLVRRLVREGLLEAVIDD